MLCQTWNWLSASSLMHSVLIQSHNTVEASFKCLQTVDIQQKPQEVNLNSYLTGISIGNGLNIYQPQISHFLFGFVLRFLPAIRVMLYSQTSFKQFQKLQCFLSNTNNMHILATETEEQAIYSGHLWTPFIQVTQQCP